MFYDYLSLWIANLGVEPLFAIIFFLALPAFFFLNFLLVLVCCVFEAIIFPLCNKVLILYKFREIFLSTIANNVKVFLATYVIMLHCPAAFPSDIKEIFISKGEHYEIELKNIKSYSVGNKEVIKHIFQKKNKKVLIKGKQIGFSDIVVWNTSGKKTYHIYVISKKEHLSKMTLIQSLRKLELEIKAQGEIIYVSGSLKKEEQFLMINKLLAQKPKNLILNIKLSNKLKNIIVSKALIYLYQAGADEAKCKILGVNINCLTKGLSKDLLLENFLNDKYNIKLNYDLYNEAQDNYLISLKLVQIETKEQSHLKLGLNEISTSIKDVLNFHETISSELINIGNLDLSIKTLAEPQTTIIRGKKATIQLGGEIPFTNGTQNQITTEWKFYGLKIDLSLSEYQSKQFIHYNSEMTSPSENSIVGSKGSSSVFVSSNQYIKLFEVGHKIDYSNSSYIPLLGKIPFLKALFSSKNKSDSFKHIICYLKLEKLNE